MFYVVRYPSFFYFFTSKPKHLSELLNECEDSLLSFVFPTVMFSRNQNASCVLRLFDFFVFFILRSVYQVSQPNGCSCILDKRNAITQLYPKK